MATFLISTPDTTGTTSLGCYSLLSRSKGDKNDPKAHGSGTWQSYEINKGAKVYVSCSLAPQALGFDIIEAGRHLLEVQAQSTLSTAPAQFSQEKTTALAIGPLFSLSSVFSNLEEINQSRLWGSA